MMHACMAGRRIKPTGLMGMRRRAAHAPWAGSAQEFWRWAKSTASWAEVHTLFTAHAVRHWDRD